MFVKRGASTRWMVRLMMEVKRVDGNMVMYGKYGEDGEVGGLGGGRDRRY
jgi:hypothetical protein